MTKDIEELERHELAEALGVEREDIKGVERWKLLMAFSISYSTLPIADKIQRFRNIFGENAEVFVEKLIEKENKYE